MENIFDLYDMRNFVDFDANLASSFSKEFRSVNDSSLFKNWWNTSGGPSAPMNSDNRKEKRIITSITHGIEANILSNAPLSASGKLVVAFSMARLPLQLFSANLLFILKGLQ